MAKGTTWVLPLVYVGVLLTALVVFSSIYRKRKIEKLASFKPWFEENHAKEMYYALKNIQDVKVPDKLLKAALLRWASEDVRQMVKLSEIGPTLFNLHQQGFLGDDVKTRYQNADKLLQVDLSSITVEAENYKQNWSQQLISTSAEIAQNEAIRKRIRDASSLNTEYRLQYDTVRKSTHKELGLDET